MSFDPLTAAFDLGKIAIEKLFPDKTKRAEEMRKLEEMRQSGDLALLNAHVQIMLAQIKVNEAEAKSDNIFVAGWRPFVGWVCGFALAYSAILEPFMRFIATTYMDVVPVFPVIDTTITMQVLLGMLGLAGMRTREKEKGVASGSKGGKK
jgi:hypothetical protein